jgi:hypothetical protein
VVGLHIDFGPLSTWALNPDGNHERFVALTLYKLSLLQQSVVDAKTAGALKNGDTTKMMSAALADAVKKLGRGDAPGALGHIKQFLKFVAAAKYTAIPGQNYNGEHLMRGTNIEFTLRVKVIPYGTSVRPRARSRARSDRAPSTEVLDEIGLGSGREQSGRCCLGPPPRRAIASAAGPAGVGSPGWILGP